jgi:hypothetical protein
MVRERDVVSTTKTVVLNQITIIFCIHGRTLMLVTMMAATTNQPRHIKDSYSIYDRFFGELFRPAETREYSHGTNHLTEVVTRAPKRVGECAPQHGLDEGADVFDGRVMRGHVAREGHPDIGIGGSDASGWGGILRFRKRRPPPGGDR